jgi:hypothetical protein
MSADHVGDLVDFGESHVLYQYACTKYFQYTVVRVFHVHFLFQNFTFLSHDKLNLSRQSLPVFATATMY